MGQTRVDVERDAAFKAIAKNTHRIADVLEQIAPTLEKNLTPQYVTVYQPVGNEVFTTLATHGRTHPGRTLAVDGVLAYDDDQREILLGALRTSATWALDALANCLLDKGKPRSEPNIEQARRSLATYRKECELVAQLADVDMAQLGNDSRIKRIEALAGEVIWEQVDV